MITIDCTPVRVLLDKENLANKIDLLRDTIESLSMSPTLCATLTNCADS